MMDLGCLTAIDDRTHHRFFPFWLSMSPQKSILVSDGKRYILLPILGLCNFGVAGKFPLDLSLAK